MAQKKSVLTKKNVNVQVHGQPDSLNDYLKIFLFREAKLSFSELVSKIEKLQPNGKANKKLEKNIKRCLVNNPCFKEVKKDIWSLKKNTNRYNNRVFKYLQQNRSSLNISSIKAALKEGGEEVTEKSLAYDGRFIRLKGGCWSLVSWDIMQPAGRNEAGKIVNFFEKEKRPCTLEKIASSIPGWSLGKTELLTLLQKDKRFVWVGGHFWFLKNLLPEIPAVAAAEEEELTLQQNEISVLQEAELMLILSDTDAKKRDYILSASDLKTGVLRVTKRMSKLFNGLPAVAWLTFETGEGTYDAWYLREGRCILGLGEWFQNRQLEPGDIIRIEAVEEDERTFKLIHTGEKEDKVYEEGRRVLELEKLSERYCREQVPFEELLRKVLELYPDGLSSEELERTLSLVIRDKAQDFQSILEQYPYFVQENGDLWKFNASFYNTYLNLSQEIGEIQEELKRTQREAAATLEKADKLRAEKEKLQGELVYLQNSYREQEGLQQDKMQRLREQNDKLLRENEKLRKEIGQLRRRIERLQDELEPTRQQVLSLKTEREKLRNRLQQLESRVVQLQGSLRRSLEEERGEYERLRQELEDMQTRFQGAMLTNEDLQRTIVKLQEERTRLKKQLSSRLVRLAVALSGLFGGGKN